MAERIAVADKNVFWVKAKEEVACRVSVAHRADYEQLVRKGKVLAVYDDNGAFHFVEPVGSLSFLRKECVNVIGPAKRVVVETEKGRLFARRV